MKKAIILLMFILFASSVYAAVPTPTLRYKFDNNADSDGTENIPAYLESGCEYWSNLTMQGTHSVHCKKGANGVINISNLNPFYYNGTYCTWFALLDQIALDNNFAVPLGNIRSDFATGGFTQLFLDNGKLEIDGRFPVNHEVSYTNAAINYTSFNHICFTWNGTNASIYVNGSEVASGEWGRYNHTTIDVMKINTYGYAEEHNGQGDTLYDDWKYWNGTVLNNAEVLEVYGGSTAASQFLITAIDYDTRLTISSFNATINDTVEYYTTNGTIVTDIYDNTTTAYNITLFAKNYVNQTYLNWYANETLNGSLTYYYDNTLVTFNFKDDFDQDLIGYENVTANVISDLVSYNFSTNNGTYLLNMTYPNDYTIRYEALGYMENFYYLNLLNTSIFNLTLYLVNDSLGSNVTATVYDYTNDLLENIEIRAAKFFINSNSYLTVSECKTNFLGTCNLDIHKNTEYYKFYLFNDGVLVKTTSPTYIYDNSINFQINLGEVVGTDYYNSQIIYTALNFNNDTNNFRFDFSDNSGVASNYCLEIEQKTSLRTASFNSSCVSTTSGTILLNVPEINGTTFIANGYATINSENYLLDSKTISFQDLAPNLNLMLLFLIIFTILAALSFAFSITVGVIVTPLPLLLFTILNLVNLNIGIAIGVEILGIILAIILNRNG